MPGVRVLRFVRLAIGILLLISCAIPTNDNDDGDTKKGVDGGAETDVTGIHAAEVGDDDAFFDEMTRLQCAGAEHCLSEQFYADESDGGDGYDSVDDCIDDQQDDIDQQNDAVSDCDFDLDNANACLEAIAVWANTCDDDDGDAIVDACDRVFDCN